MEYCFQPEVTEFRVLRDSKRATRVSVEGEVCISTHDLPQIVSIIEKETWILEEPKDVQTVVTENE